MFRQIRKFLILDWQRKSLLVQAFFLLGWARISLLRKPFKTLVAELDLHRESVSQPALSPAIQETARVLGWAVRAASNFTPWDSTCLVQVLAAQRMLKTRAIPGVFYLGATNARPGNELQSFLAHAWLMCDGEFITGESGHQQYTVVSSFSWQ